MNQKQHEEAVYAALKRKEAEEDLGPVGRWLFLAGVIAFGIGGVVFLFWVNAQT